MIDFDVFCDGWGGSPCGRYKPLDLARRDTSAGGWSQWGERWSGKLGRYVTIWYCRRCHAAALLARARADLMSGKHAGRPLTEIELAAARDIFPTDLLAAIAHGPNRQEGP